MQTNHDTQHSIFDPVLPLRESPKTHASVIKRREIRAKLDDINEQRELRRLIEEEWNI